MSSVQLTLDDAKGPVNFGYVLKSNEVDHGVNRFFYTNLAGLALLGSGGGDVYQVNSFPAATQVRITAAGLGNALDYSQYVGNVTVNLPLGLATGLTGGISKIQNVTGSQGNDLIVGDTNANVLIGGTGRNILIGGAGSDILDASKSTGDNILIGGTTDYDTNLPDLLAIFKKWTRTDLGFTDRFSDLTSGTNGQGKTPLNQVNGVFILLNPMTGHGDGSPDMLEGTTNIDPMTLKRAHNWFLYDVADTVVNLLNGWDKQMKVK